MTDSKLELLKVYLESQKWHWRPGKTISYGEQIIVFDGTYSSVIDYYPKNHSFVVGGSNSPLKEQLNDWIKSQKQSASKSNSSSLATPFQEQQSPDNEQNPSYSIINSAHVGMDESGKGDWFGPLVVAAVYASEEVQKELRRLGIRDSKALKPSQILEKASQIRQLLPAEYYAIDVIEPKRYNQLYIKHNNINLLLAECYAQLATIIRDTAECSVFVCDQFSQDANRLRTAFQLQQLPFPLQLHGAESESIPVAAASILASAAFAEALQSLGIEAGLSKALPKGASQISVLEDTAKQILIQGGETALAQYAKVHFQPIRNLLEGRQNMAKSSQSQLAYVESLGPYLSTIYSIRYYTAGYWHLITMDGCIVEWAERTTGLMSVKGAVNSKSYKILKPIVDGKVKKSTSLEWGQNYIKSLEIRINELISPLSEIKPVRGIGWRFSKAVLSSRFQFTDGSILQYYPNGTLVIQGTPEPATRAILEQIPNPFLLEFDELLNRLKAFFPDWQLGSDLQEENFSAVDADIKTITGINWEPFWPANYQRRISASFPNQNPCQLELIQDWSKVLSPETMKNHLVAHAPTGLGKTISALVPALAWVALAPDKRRIYYLVNRVNQHDSPMDALKHHLAPLFQENVGRPLRVVDLVGHSYLCHYPNSSTIQKSCQTARAGATFELLPNKVATWQEVKEHLGRRVCPYHTLQGLIPQANVVICDYWWFFSPSAQESEAIKRIMNVNAQDCILIVDEAHNLPLRVRKELHVEATIADLRKALQNAPTSTQQELRNILNTLASAKTISQKEIVQKVGGSDTIQGLLLTLTEEETSSSYPSILENILRLLLYPENAAFFAWDGSQEKRTLHASLLDSALILKIGYQSFHSSISMSGTLAAPSDDKDELEYLLPLLGLSPTKTLVSKYSSPFAAKNCRWIYCPDTRGTAAERMNYFDSYAQHAIKIGRNTPGITAVFFSSYPFLAEVYSRVAIEVPPDCIFDERSLKIEREDNDQTDLNYCQEELEKIVQKYSFGFLFAVYQGKIAEGANFSNNLIKTVICISLPIEYSQVHHERLKQLYSQLFARIAIEHRDVVEEKSDEYAIRRVSLSLVLQACGRGIRKESDRCAFVLLDERYGDKEYRWRKFFDPRPYNLSEPEKIVTTFHQYKPATMEVKWDEALLSTRRGE